jgi:hypothetical protein
MATEAPGLSPRDWSITTQEDGTLRVSRSQVWKNAIEAKALLRNLGLALTFGWLWRIASQFPAEFWWGHWLGQPALALFLCLKLLNAGVGILRWRYIRKEWVLGHGFLEEHQQIFSIRPEKAFQGCSIHLAQHRIFYSTSLWCLYLDGESAREQEGHDVGFFSRGCSLPNGHLLTLDSRRNGPDQLRALGELISSRTGWPFCFHPHSPDGNRCIE